MNKRAFDSEFLKDELDLPYSATDDRHITSTRWTEHRKCVFEFEGKFWEVSYSQGLTEMQDEYPFEYPSKILATEVELTEKTIQVWTPVETSEN